MKYIYYEPIKDQIYLADDYQGENPHILLFATDGEFSPEIWYFTKPEYRFTYIGEI